MKTPIMPILAVLALLPGMGPAAPAFPGGPAALDPAPYDRVFAGVEWRSPEGLRLAFCLLGRAGEERARTIAVYELTEVAAAAPSPPGAAPAPGRAWVRVWLDRDRGFHPFAIMVAELDGDPLPEVAVLVHKSTRYDPAPADRLFIFDWAGDVLSAKWLGSRLGLPLLAAGFARAPDGLDRLVTVEHSGRERLALRLYRYDGFGFSHERDLWRVSFPRDYDAARERLLRELAQLQVKGVNP